MFYKWGEAKIKDVIIEKMTDEFILWRCIHSGPLSKETIETWPEESPLSLEEYRRRNVPLLKRLTALYGACAIVARSGEQIVAQLRFYPKEICDMPDAGYLCLQQDFPAGSTDKFVDTEFPPFEQLEDKTLYIHCMLIAGSATSHNPYLRQGIGSRMVRYLINWATEYGWESIRADAFEDLPLIYEITGDAGYTFWEKLGFHIVDRHPHPELQGEDEFVSTLEEQAKANRIPIERAKDRIVMQYNLKSNSRSI